MKLKKRDFLKLCGIAAIATIMPGFKAMAAKIKRSAMAARPPGCPGKLKPLNQTKIEKPGDWQG